MPGKASRTGSVSDRSRAVRFISRLPVPATDRCNDPAASAALRSSGLENENAPGRARSHSCLSSIALREWCCCLKLNANALSQGGHYKFPLESVIPKRGQVFDGYDLMLASQA